MLLFANILQAAPLFLFLRHAVIPKRSEESASPMQRIIGNEAKNLPAI